MLEGEVLQEVVRLSRTRILQRLGSNRTKQNFSLRRHAPLGSTLKTVTTAVAKRMHQGIAKPSDHAMAQLFVQNSNTLQLLLKELESCPAMDVDRKLQQVVATASRLDKAAHLPSILTNVPAQQLQPSTIEAFVRRLGKLARYYRFSRCLYQTAKNTRLFRYAEVKTVSLPPDWFVMSKTPTPTYSLDDCFARCAQRKTIKPELCRILGTTVTEAKDAVNGIARKTMDERESKIHAEIQILAHYELSPAKLPPRVIASNKDACFLCNEVIRLHGKYHTPRSHGKLYTGWRLPDMAVPRTVRSELNTALENQIASLCRQILPSKTLPAALQRNESTIFPESTSMSTILSLPASKPASPIQSIKPSNIETVHPPPICPQASSERHARSPAPEQPGVTVAPERSKAERMDSGYVSMSSTGSEHDNDQPNIRAQSIPETDGKEPASEPIPEPSKGPPSRSNEGVGNNTSSVNFPSVKAEKTTEEVTPLISVGGSRSGEHPVEEHVACAKGKGKQPAQVYDEIPLVSLPVEETPSRRSVVALRKGVVVKCRLTDYTSFLAGNLTIIPECVRLPRNTPECKIRVEWLEDGHEAAPITDVWTLSEVVETYTPDCFLLRHGDIVVRVDVIKS